MAALAIRRTRQQSDPTALADDPAEKSDSRSEHRGRPVSSAKGDPEIEIEAAIIALYTVACFVALAVYLIYV
jgi:hypothetical protein